MCCIQHTTIIWPALQQCSSAKCYATMANCGTALMTSHGIGVFVCLFVCFSSLSSDKKNMICHHSDHTRLGWRVFSRWWTSVIQVPQYTNVIRPMCKIRILVFTLSNQIIWINEFYMKILCWQHAIQIVKLLIPFAWISPTMHRSPPVAYFDGIWPPIVCILKMFFSFLRIYTSPNIVLPLALGPGIKTYYSYFEKLIVLCFVSGLLPTYEKRIYTWKSAQD